jgi:hypothetical protein
MKSNLSSGYAVIATRIFPGEENSLALVLELSEKLRFLEPCPLSLSDGL